MARKRKYTVRTQVTFTEEQAKAIQEEADDLGMTFATYVRLMVMRGRRNVMLEALEKAGKLEVVEVP